MFQFDISKIKVASNKLLSEKLLEFNKLEISKLLANEKNNKFLVERIKNLVMEAFPEKYGIFVHTFFIIIII